MSYKFEFDGIGTHWWVEMWGVGHEASAIGKSIQNIVSKFESDYSRFKLESLVGQLNETKELRNPPQELLDIINASIEFTKLSDGIFNIGIAHILEDIGYDRDYSFAANSKSDLLPTPSLPTSREYSPYIRGRDNEVTAIRIPENIKIDLGGIGKGWLIDKLSKFLLDSDVKYFSINGGGDIYATSNEGKPFKFYLENPFDTTEAIGEIEIMNESIASSSPNRRSWTDKRTGKKFHHLINTKNVSDFKTKKAAVYTQAKDATLADVASTILFLAEDFDKYAKKMGVEYLLVFEDGSYKKSPAYKARLFV